MTKPLHIEHEAALELEEAVLWYEQRRAGLGARFLDAIDATLENIAAFPRAEARVPRVSAGIPARRLPVNKFPFHVVFLETEHALWVLAFAHDRRRPNYWKHRVRPQIR